MPNNVPIASEQNQTIKRHVIKWAKWSTENKGDGDYIDICIVV